MGEWKEKNTVVIGSLSPENIDKEQIVRQHKGENMCMMRM